MEDKLNRVRSALASTYRVERELGAGGMATVYLAEDLKHHRKVAVKVLRPELAAVLGPERFLREIETTANLRHPHILPLYDSGTAGGPAVGGRFGTAAESSTVQPSNHLATEFLFYVMPFIEGESLRERLNREKQLPLDDSLRIAREVADALSYAHGRGVIHRDIKPENILLESGHAMVADFGIARAISAAGRERLTETGLAIGTPAYMSPEQASGERDLDGRSDIYALGCVLYEMLAGQPPFTGPTAQAIRARHAVDPIPPLRTTRGLVPPSVEGAVLRALAKVPADRFATATQMVEALESPMAEPPQARGLQGQPMPRRRLIPGLAWSGAAVGLVLAAVWGWLPGLPWARSPLASSATTIAVLPLGPSVPDTALSRLGRDLVFTLSANLDGVGEIRTVDPHTILVQSRDPFAMYSLAEGVDLGRRFGATSVVHGSLVWVGHQVRFDLGLYRSEDLAPLGRVSVTAPADSIVPVTDTVVRSLLRQIWRGGQAPTPSLDAALKTHSVTALRAFLEGERGIVEGRWEDAEAAFGRAMEADSTFWLAYARYSYSREWNISEPDPKVERLLQKHRAALPERERLELEAGGLGSDSMELTVALRQRITERFPDNWFSWMVYADILMHDGPMVGVPATEAQAAFDRTLKLNPQLVSAWEHRMLLALTERDTATSRLALDAFQRLGARPQNEYGDLVLYLRYLDRLQRRAPDTALYADSMLYDMIENRRIPRHFYEPFRHGYSAAQVEFTRKYLGQRATEANLAEQRHLLAYSWAARGAWDSALVAADDYVLRSGGAAREAPIQVYGLAVLGAWLGGIAPRLAESRRASATTAASALGADAEARVAWLDGILGFLSLDRERLAYAQATLLRSSSPEAELLHESLEPYSLALEGHTREAGRALAAFEWRVADRSYAGLTHPDVIAINRFAASAWLLEGGDTVQAARILVAFEAAFFIHPADTPMIAASAIAFLERARIEESQGQSELAMRHYAGFLRRYDLPVPSHQPLVLEARGALRRLGGER